MIEDYNEFALAKLLEVKAEADDIVENNRGNLMFICNSIIFGKENKEFKLKLLAWVMQHKPTKDLYPKLYSNPFFIQDEGTTAWWDVLSFDHRPNVYVEKSKFLGILIKKLKDEQGI